MKNLSKSKKRRRRKTNRHLSKSDFSQVSLDDSRESIPEEALSSVIAGVYNTVLNNDDENVELFDVVNKGKANYDFSLLKSKFEMNSSIGIIEDDNLTEKEDVFFYDRGPVSSFHFFKLDKPAVFKLDRKMAKIYLWRLIEYINNTPSKSE